MGRLAGAGLVQRPRSRSPLAIGKISSSAASAIGRDNRCAGSCGRSADRRPTRRARWNCGNGARGVCSCVQEIFDRGNLIARLQKGRVADAGNSISVARRPALAHLLRRIGQQNVGFRAAHYQGGTGDRIPERPQVDVGDRALAKGVGDRRIVDRTDRAVVVLSRAVLRHGCHCSSDKGPKGA